MEKLPSISVLGCGWLGLPVAKHLAEQGYKIKGSTTSAEKIATLQVNKIGAYLVQFPLKANNDTAGFFDSDILLLNIPPKGRPGEFVENVKEVIALATANPVKHILFISSTSVYADSNSNVTENTTAMPGTASGNAILEAENLLKAERSFTTTSIRFAGLAGPGRHPGRFLAGKKDISNGLAPINLVHLDDCIGILDEIIRKEAFGNTFNACSPYHPSRKEFYTLAAACAGLPLPVFIDEKISWKLVESIHVPGQLGYTFKFRDQNTWERFLRHEQ